LPSPVFGSATVGVGLVACSSLGSSFAGIYNEKLLKSRLDDSIHWQNAQLYLWGVCFNAVGFYFKDRALLSGPGMFTGFSWLPCTVVLVNATTGIAISVVLKFADNIARVFAHACAVVVTFVASVYVFEEPITIQIVFAIILVITALVQYNISGLAEAVDSSPPGSASLPPNFSGVFMPSKCEAHRVGTARAMC